MYEVHYQKHAASQLYRMAPNIAQRICAQIDAVAVAPYAKHPNATRLRGRSADFRL